MGLTGKQLLTYIGGMVVTPDRKPDVFAAISHRARRQILELLTEDMRSVSDIAAHFEMSRPAVSQHLKVLKDAGLVIDQPAGNRRIYRINPDGLDALRADLDRFWGSALTSYKTLVEQQEQEDS